MRSHLLLAILLATSIPFWLSSCASKTDRTEGLPTALAALSWDSGELPGAIDSGDRFYSLNKNCADPERQHTMEQLGSLVAFSNTESEKMELATLGIPDTLYAHAIVAKSHIVDISLPLVVLSPEVHLSSKTEGNDLLLYASLVRANLVISSGLSDNGSGQRIFLEGIPIHAETMPSTATNDKKHEDVLKLLSKSVIPVYTALGKALGQTVVKIEKVAEQRDFSIATHAVHYLEHFAHLGLDKYEATFEQGLKSQGLYSAEAFTELIQLVDKGLVEAQIQAMTTCSRRSSTMADRVYNQLEDTDVAFVSTGLNHAGGIFARLKSKPVNIVILQPLLKQP